MKVTQEEVSSWTGHPVTLAYMEALKSGKLELQESLCNGGGFSDGYTVGERYNYYMGMFDILDKVANPALLIGEAGLISEDDTDV